MANLIPLDLLTVEDIKKVKEFKDGRNLFNKYTEEELKDWIKVDLYEALDLEQYRGEDIPLDILKYSFKRKKIYYHPSRQRERSQGFLIVTRAFEVLSDTKSRKVYESCFLDESLPEDREYELADFLKYFGDAFYRNGIFSEIKPVPNINSDIEKFYKFWNAFKSNRVYENPDEFFDVSGSSRRSTAEKNKKAAHEAKIRDLKRIDDLVKLSYKRDPRICRKKIDTEPWNLAQEKTLLKFDSIFGKSDNKFTILANKLNDLYLTKRSSKEIKDKLLEISKSKNK